MTKFIAEMGQYRVCRYRYNTEILTTKCWRHTIKAR